jgi:hypothetical protein
MAALEPGMVLEAEYAEDFNIFFRRLGEITFRSHARDLRSACGPLLSVLDRYGVVIFSDGQCTFV